MARQFFVKDYAPKILTEEEKAEAERQQGMLGVKQSKKLYCSAKVAAGYRTFFHGRGNIGKVGVEKDGRHFIQIFAMNSEIKCMLAGMTSGEGVHLFLNDCYDYSVELYKKSIAAAAKAVQTDADYIKLREEVLKNVEQNLSEMRADQSILQSQKIKKPMPPFDKDNFKTWAGFDQENAERSKSNLIEKKTACLAKIKECEKSISSREVERKPFDGKISELQVKLDTDLSEGQFKDIKLSLEYQELNIKKIEAKIEKSENEKSKVETELEQLERQIQVLNCVLDHHSLIHEVKNFEDRKARTVARLEKILNERADLYTMRENLNKQWVELTKEEEPEKKPVSIFSQDKPMKPEELCEALALKADAENYFI